MKAFVFLVILRLVWIESTNAQIIDWNLIDLSNSPTVSGKINGFNMGGYAYGRINNQSGNITVPSECNQCGSSLPLMSGAAYSSMQTKPNVVNQTAKLNPGVLRFPGGTHSGWYHLYEYDNQGFYDASAPLFDKGYGMTAIEAGHLNNPLSYCRQDSRITVDQNFIDGFINYIINVQNATVSSNKIEVTYVANLLTHFTFQANQTLFSNCGRTKTTTPMDNYDCSSTFTYTYTGNETLFNNDPDIYRFELYYKETQDAIDKLVTNLTLNATDVLYVEMGNEYYSTSGYPYSKYQMDVNDYAQLVEIYSERLRCYFSGKVDIKIGVVTKPITPWQNDLVSIFDMDSTGNGVTLNESIDAVIYHHYYSESTCLTDTDINTRFNCAKDAFRDHIETDLTNNLDLLQTDFPDQKIWITEWNMLKGDDDKNNSYVNTVLHASFVQEYALGILEYNVLHNDAVSMLTHHRIGDHNLWSVIQTSDGSNTEANYRSGAHVMEYMSKLYTSDEIHITGNVLTDGTTTFDTKEAKVMAFVQYADGSNPKDKLLLYYSNKTNADINYTIPLTIDNVLVDSATLSSVGGNHLFTYGPRNVSAGKNRYTETSSITHNNADLDNLGYGDIDDQFIIIENVSLAIDAPLTLPKNSIGVIEIALDDIPLNMPIIESSASSLSIYPNPTSGELNLLIDMQMDERVEIELYTSIGRRVRLQSLNLSAGINKHIVNTEDLPNGIYLLTMTNSNNEITSKKVIVSHKK